MWTLNFFPQKSLFVWHVEFKASFSSVFFTAGILRGHKHSTPLMDKSGGGKALHILDFNSVY